MAEIPTITVTGRGQVSVPPDKTVITFDIAAEDLDYAAAVEDLNRQVGRLRRSLQGAGIDPDQLKTAEFSVSPHHESRKKGEDYEQVFIGWNASQSLTLEMGADRQQIGKAVTAIAESGAASSVEFAFQVADQAAFRAKVLAEATRDACLQARTIAEAAGCRLGKPLKITYGWTQMSFDSPALCDSSISAWRNEAPDVRPVNVEGADSVTILFALE